jgi:acylphosphatase
MRYHFIVRGNVQGIGYRLFVSQLAKKMALTGWVKNCSNSDVAGEVQGPPENLNLFLERLKTGHSWAQVDHLFHEPITEKENEIGFQITY